MKVYPRTWEPSLSSLGPGAAQTLETSEIYGVVLETPFPLAAAHPCPGERPHIRVSLCPPGKRVGDAQDRPLLLDAVVEGERLYALSKVEDQYHLRVCGLADFFLDLTSGSMLCACYSGVNLDLVHVLLTGMIPALWLYLHDVVVLHAATVQVESVTIAVVGRSGMGKSTLAAILCAGGSRLVGDDVLAVRVADVGKGKMAGWRGTSPELRLRPAVGEIASSLLPEASCRTTADGRIAISPLRADVDHGRLDIIVIPTLIPAQGELTARRLPPAEALIRLMGFPRLTGWRDQGVLRCQFQGHVELVQAVPVVEVQIPWEKSLSASLLGKLWPALLGAASGTS